MAAVLRRKPNLLMANVPSLLTWRNLRFRAICISRLGFLAQHPSADHEHEPPVTPGRKVLETFKEEFEIGSRTIAIETGKIARFANGSVVITMDETNVLSTVASSKGDGVRDFLPLTVDYQEKQYAHGVIPTTFMRREGAPKERELLCGRIIDRPIRPLFPAGFYHEVQIMVNVLSSDGKQDPDVMAANATSAALMLSDIPWDGPIGMIRLGRIDGQFVFNPTMDELSLSDLNLVYACAQDRTLMIDVQAREISEKDLEAGLKLAHNEAIKYIEPQIRLTEKAGKQKKEYKLSMIPERTFEKIKNLAEVPIEAVFTDSRYGKFERGEALDKITQAVKAKLEEECDEESLKVLPKTIDAVRKKIVRQRIIEKGLRVDGRRLDEVRPLYCESGTYPILHGSSLFSRGDTQVLCTVTLGAPGDAQRLDSIVGPPTKRFMLHYSFPPFSINEVGKRGGLNRREVGHDEAAGSSEEELSGGEIEVQESHLKGENRDLKDKLLRKYSGYLSSLKQEFSKKKKKGKLPKEARQVLFDWWTAHYKWPYPTEADKIALAESTGLDQKQINNWFINQRKRHWKPSENMQFAVMDSLSAPFYDN